ncbi:MAG: hypothetical protein H3C35_09725, partial [Bacteroidetes bacterium]|nr:hypothetical protein [Bacteroidota bacterium]
MKTSTLFSLVLIIILVSSSVFAGGPLYTQNGKAVRFKSDTIKYHLDRGSFGVFTNQQARTLA